MTDDYDSTSPETIIKDDNRRRVGRDDVDTPNLVSSECFGIWKYGDDNFTEDNLRHIPSLDIDMRVIVSESKTGGHHHLTLPDVRLTPDQYERLLTVLAECGIIQDGFLARYRVNGATFLRIKGDK